EFQQSLAASTTAQECWVVLRNACREAGFSYVALRAGGQFLEDENKRQQTGPSLWCVQVPLSGSDYVVFRQDPRLTELAILIVPFVDGLRSKLSLPEVPAETVVAQMRKVPTALAS
ncbi:MAG: hypothetical protein ABSC05_27875, partial [Candidatus Solibacter sp.]